MQTPNYRFQPTRRGFAKLLPVLVSVGVLITALSACQTAQHAAMSKPVADAAPLVGGVWKGNFINTRGQAYPMTFALTGDGGKVTGKADIPSSSVDKTPSLDGSVDGANVRLVSSGNFTYDLTMTTDGAGGYAMSGPVSGPNTGRADLTKSN